MKVTVCIGSSCHVKGSRQVIEQLRALVGKHALENKVEMDGTFCLGHCQQGVCVMVDDSFHSVSPSAVDEFFSNEILAKV